MLVSPIGKKYVNCRVIFGMEGGNLALCFRLSVGSESKGDESIGVRVIGYVPTQSSFSYTTPL
jgi:hypothetical protein